MMREEILFGFCASLRDEVRMKNLTTRQWHTFGFLLIIAVLTTALYFQFVQDYEPCVLCEVQRFIYMLLAIAMFGGVLHNPGRWGWRIYSFIFLLIASLGAVIAGRQVWLQHLPADQVPACGPDLNFIVENMSAGSAIRQIFYGTADCATISWSFWGLSFAGWSLVTFLFIALISLWHMIAPKQS